MNVLDRVTDAVPGDTLSPAGEQACPVVSRTCTEVGDGSSSGHTTEPKPLSDFRDVSTYVLLGDPGSGKTTEFEQESRALGDAAEVVTARNFITLELANHPEWCHRTLYIDGLDEMRAGAADARSPLDEIRRRLEQLGRPKFRISCREADWLGRSDLRALTAVSPDDRVIVLRLDSLNSASARELLESVLESAGSRLDAQEFVDEALRRCIHSMLSNPLTLTLLAEAVGWGGDWPRSRLETFDSACRRMASEQNEEHRDVARGVHPLATVTDPGTLVDAAGYMCALILLAGKVGFSFEPEEPTSRYVSFDDLADVGGVLGRPPRDILRAVLGTKLFRAVDAGFIPLHRQIAEFLAGRYLAGRIDDGLPARRVVALMTGSTDGRVVTVLRGVSGWLAAHSPEARPLLIDADPAGVALYGDIQSFETGNKARLLRALGSVRPYEPIFDYERPGSVGDTFWVDEGWAFRSLASADMADAIMDMLDHGGPEAADERLERLILGALSHADESERGSLSGLLPALEARARDDSRSTGLRCAALDAVLHLLSPSDRRTGTLLELLDELDEGAVADADGELSGTLLDDLYPAVVTPQRVWRYLPGRGARVSGRFWQFWQRHLLERSSDDQVAELLDALDESVQAGSFPIVADRVRGVHVELLARGLVARGDTIATERLYRWLSIPVTDDLRFESVLLWEKPLRRIRSWLEVRPEAQKAMFLARLRHRIEDQQGRRHHWRDLHFLHGSRLPADFGRWCLKQAVGVSETEPELSQELLRYSHAALTDPAKNDELTLDVMRERSGDRADLTRLLEKLCAPPPERTDQSQDPYLRRVEELRAQRQEEDTRRRDEWSQYLRFHEAEAHENRLRAPELHTLASEYLGRYSDSNTDAHPRERIADFIGDDDVAVEAALAALRRAVWRDDIPEVGETIELHSRSEQSWLAYPVLASLQRLDEESPALLDELPESAKRKALAIHYCTLPGVPNPDRPSWHDRWLDQDPALVLDVLRRCAAKGIRRGEDFPPGLTDLSAITGHDDLVYDVRLRLLRSFQVGAPNARLSLLEGLLNQVLDRALDCRDTGTLEGLVARKLSSPSMTVGQRVRWLAVDAALSPVPGLPRLMDFVGGREVRARHLAVFLGNLVEFVQRKSDHVRTVWSVLSQSREPATLRVLIEMLGPLFAPTEWRGYISTAQGISAFLTNVIEQLASLPGSEAQQALSDLVEDTRLASWHGHLEQARENQRVIDRDDSYTHPTIEQVQCTLENRGPGNAADLAALLFDRLADIRDDIRGGNSNRWRQFWNEDAHGRVIGESPAQRSAEAAVPGDVPGRKSGKPEDSCRDALLAALQLRLPQGVEAVPEGRYAAGNRADIRVACDGFNVPVEIKKNSHRDLWSALRAQLLSKYTTDPATSGHGIYLVLWFGADTTTRSPDGARPATPEELQEQLGQQLTPTESRLVSVIVIDVTRPGA